MLKRILFHYSYQSPNPFDLELQVAFYPYMPSDALAVKPTRKAYSFGYHSHAIRLNRSKWKAPWQGLNKTAFKLDLPFLGSGSWFSESKGYSVANRSIPDSWNREQENLTISRQPPQLRSTIPLQTGVNYSTTEIATPPLPNQPDVPLHTGANYSTTEIATLPLPNQPDVAFTIPSSSLTNTDASFGIAPAPLAVSSTVLTYYVATNGSDANVGTIERPFQTLQRAISQITNGGGGTIYVRGGNYQPSQGIWIGDNTDGSANSRLVIRPYQNERVIIDGSQMFSSGANGIGISGDYIDIIGFEIRNIRGAGIAIFDANNVQILNNTVHNIQASGIASYGSYRSVSDRNSNIHIDSNTVYRTNLLKGAYRDDPSVNWGMGISIGFSDNVTVTNNRVYENYGEGIGFYVSTNSLAARNVVYNNYALGIYLDSARNIIVNSNFIYNTGNPEYFRNGVPSNGIQMANESYSFIQYDQSPYYLNNNQILNNIVVNVGTGLFYGTYTGFGNGDGRNFYGLRNTTILNNTFYNPNLFVWMDPDPNTVNVTVANNIFARTARDGLLANIPNTNNIIFGYNLWSGGNQIEGNQSVLGGTNIQVSDPGLVNPGSFNASDYRLRLGSPAINAGSYRSNVSTDYFGQPRWWNNIYDIGADEWLFCTN